MSKGAADALAALRMADAQRKPRSGGIGRLASKSTHSPGLKKPVDAPAKKTLTVNTKIVNTKKASNVARQLKWRAEHRDEYNLRRRERYKAKNG